MTTLKRPSATCLAEVTHDAWSIVAYRTLPKGAVYFEWDWGDWSDADRSKLQVEWDMAGTITTTHEHVPDGTVRLSARRVPTRGVIKPGNGSRSR